MDLTLIILGIVVLMIVRSGLKMLWVSRTVPLPGPTPLPLLGTILHVWKEGMKTFHKLGLKDTLKYGWMYRTWIFSTDVVTANHPEMLKKIFNRLDVYDRARREQKEFEILLGGGLILISNEYWKDMRTMMNPAFRVPNLKRLTEELFVPRVDILVNSLEELSDGQVVDIEAMFQKLTFDVTGLFTLGIDFKTQFQPDSPYHEAWNHILEHLNHRFFALIPYWKFYKTAAVIKFEKSMQLLENAIYDAIRKRENDDLENDTDLLACLLKERQQARKEGRSEISDQQIRNELLTFLFAGHDTTTNLLTWATYYLSQNPDVQKKAKEEVNSVLVHGRLQSADDLAKLKYLKAVLKETLRMKPSAPLRGRTTLKEDDMGGIRIRKGAAVAWNAYAVHMHPEFWPEPEKFDPERFLQDDEKRHAYCYIPFGGGPRKCIGENFSMNESLVALASVLSKFSFKLKEGFQPKDIITLTMRSENGMMMHIIKDRN